MHRRKRPTLSGTCVIGSLTGLLVVIWLLMHSMLAGPTRVEKPALRPASTATLVTAKGEARKPTPPQPFGPPSLTSVDVQRLSSVLGPTAFNVTRGHFISIPAWVTQKAGAPPPPCLFSPITNVNIMLFEDGWRDAGTDGGATMTGCPAPFGGQLPIAPGVDTVSVVLAFRNMASDTIRSLISVVQNARDVASVEVILLDIASR